MIFILAIILLCFADDLACVHMCVINQVVITQY